MILNCNKVQGLHVTAIGAAAAQTLGFTMVEDTVGDATTPAVMTVQTIAEAAGNLNYKGFTLNTGNNRRAFYVHFKVAGVEHDPMFGEHGRTAIVVDIAASATASVIATALALKITIGYSEGRDKLSDHFSAEAVDDVVTITNVDRGVTLIVTDGGTTSYDIDDAQDGTNAAVLNLKAVTGWVWFSPYQGGNVGQGVRRQKWMKVILNLDDPTISWSY